MSNQSVGPLILWLQAQELLSREQSDLIMKWMESRGIGEEAAILECGLFDEDDLVSIYGEIHKVRPIKLEELDIDADATRHIPARVARAHQLIPIRRTANTLAVVMADPLNAAALSALKSATDFDIIPFSGRADVIEHAIYLHYGPEANAATSEGSATAISQGIRARMLSNDDRISHMSKSLPVRREKTWGSFWKTTENQYAVSALQDLCAAEPDDVRTLVLFYGPSSSGKSHLLHATANDVTAKQPQSRTMITTATRLANFLFESVRDRKLNLFRYLYRELDLLLIDHAEELLIKDWAQQELLDTIRCLRQKRKRICLSSEVNLITSPRLLPDLRKELESGTIAEIKPFSEAGRLEIIRRTAAGAGIPEEVLVQLARNGGATMSELLEMTKALVIMAERSGESLSAGSADDVMRASWTRTSGEVVPLDTDGIPQMQS